eukprot:gb/GFBE01073890.1/.p1 GENE.gb/GFBE01073890.1/~~gb/GFBE01073890.1/.p1  ORF type:complete len:116 (+),score=24.95 gb/GFBE01073890.1/:1-348(+)
MLFDCVVGIGLLARELRWVKGLLARAWEGDDDENCSQVPGFKRRVEEEEKSDCSPVLAGEKRRRRSKLRTRPAVNNKRTTSWSVRSECTSDEMEHELAAGRHSRFSDADGQIVHS